MTPGRLGQLARKVCRELLRQLVGPAGREALAALVEPEALAALARREALAEQEAQAARAELATWVRRVRLAERAEQAAREGQETWALRVRQAAPAALVELAALEARAGWAQLAQRDLILLRGQSCSVTHSPPFSRVQMSGKSLFLLHPMGLLCSLGEWSALPYGCKPPGAHQWSWWKSPQQVALFRRLLSARLQWHPGITKSPLRLRSEQSNLEISCAST